MNWCAKLALAAVLIFTIDKSIGLFLSILPNGRSSGGEMLVAIMVPLILTIVAIVLFDDRKKNTPAKVPVKKD
ncbi:MAG: hypothetical protein GX589_10430 [Deltaproteobacteria bacterium]|nr:hypothetical protein [Deltaproteobacteria bacterium]